MDKIKVGQVLYKKKTDMRGKPIGGIAEVTVTKVGRQYFYVGDNKYHIDNMQLDTHYITHRLYVSEQNVLNEIEVSSKTNDIRNFFSGYGATALTIDQLRLIHNIINEQK